MEWQRIRSMASLGMVILFVAWAIYYVFDRAEEFAHIFEMDLRYLLPLYVLALGVIVKNGLLTAVSLEAFNVRLSAREWFSISVVTTGANYLTPMRGGAVIRAVYLNRQYRLSYLDFVATLGAVFMMQVVANGCLGMIGYVSLVLNGVHLNLSIAIFFFITTLLAVAASAFRVPTAYRENFLGSRLHRVIVGWRVLKTHPGVLSKLVALTLLYAGISVLQVLISFRALGVDLTVADVMLVTAAQGLAFLASVTPGSLGVVEGITIYLSSVLDFTLADALLQTTMLRVILLSVMFAALPFALRALSLRLFNLDAAT